MGQGSSPSGAEGGGGMGLGLLGSLFGGSGGGASGATSPSTTPYYIENPNVGGPNFGQEQQGIWGRLGQVLQDPEVLKALGDTTKNLANTISSADKIPGHAATMLQQAIGGQSNPPPQGPYVGDIPNFTPQQAQTILQALGIPGGFRSMV